MLYGDLDYWYRMQFLASIAASMPHPSFGGYVQGGSGNWQGEIGGNYVDPNHWNAGFWIWYWQQMGNGGIGIGAGGNVQKQGPGGVTGDFGIKAIIGY